MSQLSEEQLDHLVAAERARDPLPLNDWRTIASRAREEGLIADAERGGWSGTRAWMQAAAAVLVLVGGIAIGRTTSTLPGAESAATATNTPSPSQTFVNGTSFASVDEATVTLERAVADYKRASAFLAQANYPGSTTSDSSKIYSARLAALNEVGNAMESAIRTAPDDPVINQYYLATMGAKVATQQLVARPVGLALRGF
ncbi:MAG TPA: hypothetical protein VM166_04480 [Gemmatimonadaceae bacterium]|nr:hypothetical protein [Gemmatimonadaceae bacterium]